MQARGREPVPAEVPEPGSRSQSELAGMRCLSYVSAVRL